MHIHIYDAIEQFAFAFDDTLRKLLNGQFSEVMEGATAAFSRVFSGLARGEETPAMAVVAVFGIPLAAAALTAVGVAPAVVALSAWTLPAAAIVALVGQDSETNP